MVTTTEWVVDWVHGDTTDDRPDVSLGSVLVIGVACLEEWLIDTTSASDDTDGSTRVARDLDLLARWELQSGHAALWVLGDDEAVGARGSSIGTTITNGLLNIGDEGTFWDFAEWEDVADGEWGVDAAHDLLSSIDALSGDEELVVVLLGDSGTELNLGEWSASALVVHDFFAGANDVAVALSIIDRTQLGCTLAVVSVSLEDAAGTTTLNSDSSTHVAQKKRSEVKIKSLFYTNASSCEQNNLHSLIPAANSMHDSIS